VSGRSNAVTRLRKIGLLLAALGPAILLLPGHDPVASAQEQSSAAGDLAMQARAEPYIAFADQILAAVTTRQSGALRASLSPSTLSEWSGEDVDLFVDKIVMPFFADYATPVAEQWIAPTTHPAGFTGFAFYRSFTATDGRTKPYVLYVLEEDGRMVVGNLLVGKTFQDMHPQQ
jgi:hypothetical protein